MNETARRYYEDRLYTLGLRIEIAQDKVEELQKEEAKVQAEFEEALNWDEETEADHREYERSV